jgi:hypothetical protein
MMLGWMLACFALICTISRNFRVSKDFQQILHGGKYAKGDTNGMIHNSFRGVSKFTGFDMIEYSLKAK